MVDVLTIVYGKEKGEHASASPGTCIDLEYNEYARIKFRSLTSDAESFVRYEDNTESISMKDLLSIVSELRNVENAKAAIIGLNLKMQQEIMRRDAEIEKLQTENKNLKVKILKWGVSE